MIVLCKYMKHESQSQLWRPQIRHCCPAPEYAITSECSAEVVSCFIGKMVYYYCNNNDLNINTITAIIIMHVYLVILFQRLHSTVLYSVISLPARRKAEGIVSVCRRQVYRREANGRQAQGCVQERRDLEHGSLRRPTDTHMCVHTHTHTCTCARTHTHTPLSKMFTGNISKQKYQNSTVNQTEKKGRTNVVAGAGLWPFHTRTRQL